MRNFTNKQAGRVIEQESMINLITADEARKYEGEPFKEVVDEKLKAVCKQIKGRSAEGYSELTVEFKIEPGVAGAVRYELERLGYHTRKIGVPSAYYTISWAEEPAE